HMAMQRRHRTHLELSRTRCIVELSGIGFFSWLPKRMKSTPKSFDNFWSSQFLLRTQLTQSFRWSERMSSSVVLLASWTLRVFVLTSIPSETGYTHAGTSVLAFLTSTTHIRQAPISLMPFKW